MQIIFDNFPHSNGVRKAHVWNFNGDCLRWCDISKYIKEKTQVPLQKFGVVMGDNSILGINVSLYPGIFIGQNSIIEPGVVIKENIPPNSNVVLKQQLKIGKSKLKKEE